MKIFITSFLLLFLSIGLKAQTYLINNVSGQTINTCSGTFYDSGGPSSGYASGQTYTVTFCPGTAGSSVKIDFTTWAVGAGDAMELYDGNSITANLMTVFDQSFSPVGMNISASILNPTGCLTLRWTSASSANGWVANLSCSTPCQNFSATLASSVPPFHIDSGYYYIDLCPGDSMILNAIGVFPLNDSLYHQSNSTTSFLWDMGDFTNTAGSTVVHHYDTIAGYNVYLSAIDSNGCLASQTPLIRVRLSTQPDLHYTKALRTKICQWDTVSLIGKAITKEWVANSELNTAGTTFLPDGSGVSYTSTLVFNSFAPGQVLTNVAGIVKINATMEHSYLGDLNIKITCPNGNESTLKSYPGGGGTFMGEPIDDNSTTAGLGYAYSWMSNGTTTMLSAASTYTHSFTDLSGTFYPNANYLPPSTAYPATSTASAPYPLLNYLPQTPFNTLVGCPLNGSWTITVTDNLGVDNGYIFSWGIEFAQSLLPVSWSYEPLVSTQTWNNASNIIYNNANHITILGTSPGTNTYTYTIVDNFGCTYDTTVNIKVVPTPAVNLGNDTTICGFGIITMDATSNLPGVSYYWNTGNLTPIQQSNISGDFSVTVTNTDGTLKCADRDTINIKQYDKANLNLGNDTCISSDYTLHAGNLGHNPPFLYLWGDGSTQESLEITEAGIYTVTVAIDPTVDCIETDEIKINYLEPNFLGEDFEVCTFEDRNLSIPEAGGFPHSYTWYLDGTDMMFYQNALNVNSLEIGPHNIVVKVDNGCADEIAVTALDCQLEFPNIITPNGDGYNQKFVIKGIENYPNSIFIVYNRWGKKVYENSNYLNQFGDAGLTDGVYYYVLITTLNGNKEYRGSLTVIKE